MNKRMLPLIAAIITLLVVLGGTSSLVQAQRGELLARRRGEVAAIASATRARLEQALNTRLFLAQGLVAFVKTTEEINQENFEIFASELGANTTGLHSLQLSKDNVVSHIHPLAGNERAIGLNLMGSELHRPIIQRAMDQRIFVTAGPVTLVQGGVAVFGRAPIFLPQPGGGDSYWGVASVVIDRDTLLAEAGIVTSTGGLDWALRGTNGTGATGEIFFGNSAVYSDTVDPVTFDVVLPSGSWQLAVAPTGGWDAEVPPLYELWVAGGLLGLFAAALVFLLSRQPIVLQGAVARATSELRAGESRLRTVVDNVHDGILTVSPSGRVESANPAASAILGAPAEALLGRPISELIALDEGVSVPSSPEQVLRTTASTTDSEHTPLEVQVSWVRSAAEANGGALAVWVVRDLSEHQRAAAERERLTEEVRQRQEGIIQAQAAALSRLAMPIIPITRRVLVMPLIGGISGQRMETLQQLLLEGIQQHHAHTVILDITGVTMLDSAAARSLSQVVTSARLLGARIVLTGTRPEVAQALVSVGTDFSGIETYQSLESVVRETVR